MTIVEADHVDDPGAVDGLRHPLRLVDGVGQGLLAEDVLAGGGGGNGHHLMEAVADADVDRVDLRVVERRLPVGGDLLDVEALRRPTSGGLGHVHDHLQARHDLQVRIQITDLPVDLTMDLADPPDAHDRDAYLALLRHGFTPPS